MRGLEIGKGEYHTNVQLLNLIFTCIIRGTQAKKYKNTSQNTSNKYYHSLN
jgi:hypothetical protein